WPNPRPPRAGWRACARRSPPGRETGRLSSTACRSAREGRYSPLCFVLTCCPLTIGVTGGLLGPTPVPWVWLLKSCMNASPSTRLSDAPALPILMALLLTTRPDEDNSSVLPLLSVMITFSPPALSSNVRVWPLRDLITRTSLPESLPRSEG